DEVEDLCRPSGAWEFLEWFNPRLKPWAIVGRLCRGSHSRKSVQFVSNIATPSGAPLPASRPAPKAFGVHAFPFLPFAFVPAISAFCLLPLPHHPALKKLALQRHGDKIAQAFPL